MSVENISLGSTGLDELVPSRYAVQIGDIEVLVISDGVLPITVDAILGWVVREGATNVLRHSAARHCAIEIAVTAEDARVEISDDGPNHVAGGEARPGAAAGSGLDGLRERVEAIGGEFGVESSASGFRITAVVPLPGEASR